MENPRPRRPLESLDRPPAEAEAERPRSTRPGARARWLKRSLFVGLAVAFLIPVVHFIAIYDPPEAFPPRRPQTLRTQEERIFLDAKNLIRASKWTEAKALLLELQAMAPDYPSLPDYLTAVEREIPNQEHLAAAQAALAQKKLGVAKAELDQVRPDTLMAEQVDLLKKELRDTADARVREAQSLYDLNKRHQVIEIVSDVLAAYPDHRDARLLLESADPPAHMDPKPPPVGYASRMANAFYKKAAAARVKGQWARSVEWARRTLRADPGHAGATQLLTELKGKAKDLYLSAYAICGPEPEEALRIFRQVVAMTPPDDELHLKARQRIEVLLK